MGGFLYSSKHLAIWTVSAYCHIELLEIVKRSYIYSSVVETAFLA